MREIKFRGKNMLDKWVYGSYLYDLIHDRHFILTYDPSGNIRENCINPKTVGQYIGIKDKNNTEIYGGDILKWKDKGSNFPNVITNIKPVVIKNLNSLSPMIFDKSCFSNPKEDWYEVIGNMTDNPELLNK